MKTKKIEIVHRKLGQHKAVGLAWMEFKEGEWVYNGKIEIDERETGRDHLDSVIHEVNHNLHPEKSEKEIRTITKKMTAILWKLNYRRIQ